MYCATVIAHRGASAYAPENTLAAFRAARDQGCRWVETDVVLLGDGTPVLMHDATLNRCTSGTGPIAGASWEDVRHLDAGSWFGPAFAAERVPHLWAGLAALSELGLGLNLELKVAGDAAEQRDRLVRTVVAYLDAHWRDERRLLVSSFDHAALSLLQTLRPGTATGLLYETVAEDWRQTVARCRAVSIHADYRTLDRATVAAVRGAGLDVYVYTPNDPDDVREQWNWGVSGVITDDPPVFLRSLVEA